MTLQQPWRDLRPEQVVLAVGAEGKQLPLEVGMQLDVRRLIEDCWNPLPRERPSFATVIERLSKMDEINLMRRSSISVDAVASL